MKRNLILAQNSVTGTVQRCCHGVVHIHCPGASLHFTEDAFLGFASMVKEAYSRSMDEGLAELVKDLDIKGEE